MAASAGQQAAVGREGRCKERLCASPCGLVGLSSEAAVGDVPESQTAVFASRRHAKSVGRDGHVVDLIVGLDHERRPFGRTVGREPPNEQPAVSATSSHGAAVATAGNAIEVGAGRSCILRSEQHVVFAVQSREEPAAGN